MAETNIVKIEARFIGKRRLKFGAWIAIQGMRLMMQARGEYRIGRGRWRPSGRVKPHLNIDFAAPDVIKKQQESYNRAFWPQKPMAPDVESRQPVAAAMPCGCHPSGHQPWCDKADLAVEDYGG